jgi:hypothetical protein
VKMLSFHGLYDHPLFVAGVRTTHVNGPLRFTRNSETDTMVRKSFIELLSLAAAMSAATREHAHMLCTTKLQTAGAVHRVMIRMRTWE